ASIIAALSTIIAAIIGIFEYKKKDGIKLAKLTNHPVHQRLRTFKEYVKYGIEAKNRGKELLVKDFLLHSIKFHGEQIKELAIKIESERPCEEEIEAINKEYFNKIHEQTANYFYKEKYNQEEQKALRILLVKFQKYYHKKSENFINDIEEICASKYYRDPIIIQAIIFDKYIGLIASVLSWIDNVIDLLNGEFDGLNFDGSIITKEVENE
ncbi:MAG: hypothetical protein ACOC1O_04075, partial [bacterium]